MLIHCLNYRIFFIRRKNYRTKNRKERNMGFDFNQVDFFFNIIVMMFWIQIWNPAPLSLLPNNYTGFVEKLTDPVLRLLRFLAGNKQVAALLAVTLLLLFRAMAFPAPTGTGPAVEWNINMGLNRVVIPSFTVPARILFSAVSFAVFVFTTWSFEMLLSFAYGKNKPDNMAAGFVYRASFPFSVFNPRLKPLLLIALGSAIILTMNANGLSALTADRPLSVNTLRILISATAGIVNALQLLKYLIIGIIIASWIGLLLGSPTAMVASQEWLDYLLGPVLRKFRIQIGMIDLTPLVALLALDFGHRLILTILFIPYAMLA